MLNIKTLALMGAFALSPLAVYANGSDASSESNANSQSTSIAGAQALNNVELNSVAVALSGTDCTNGAGASFAGFGFVFQMTDAECKQLRAALAMDTTGTGSKGSVRALIIASASTKGFAPPPGLPATVETCDYRHENRTLFFRSSANSLEGQLSDRLACIISRETMLEVNLSALRHKTEARLAKLSAASAPAAVSTKSNGASRSLLSVTDTKVRVRVNGINYPITGKNLVDWQSGRPLNFGGVSLTKFDF
ncbi:MAG: hypothetical protein ACK4SL_00085 [Candidatus Paceibacteria bacterium]